MNKCKKCGCDVFGVNENITYKASINEKGILESYKVSSQDIESIYCWECGEDYNISDFEDINLN